MVAIAGSAGIEEAACALAFDGESAVARATCRRRTKVSSDITAAADVMIAFANFAAYFAQSHLIGG